MPILELWIKLLSLGAPEISWDALPFCMRKVDVLYLLSFLFFCFVQVSTTIKGNVAEIKKIKLKLLQLWNGIIQVLTWNPLRGLCQDSGKQRMLTNWLNRDQGTCHIENLRQAPFGGSQGQAFCIEKRKHMPKFPFNHIRSSCREHHLLQQDLFWIR